MMDGAPGLAGQYLCRRRTAVAAGQELGCCWKTIHTTLSYASLSLSLSLSRAVPANNSVAGWARPSSIFSGGAKEKLEATVIKQQQQQQQTETETRPSITRIGFQIWKREARGGGTDAAAVAGVAATEIRLMTDLSPSIRRRSTRPAAPQTLPSTPPHPPPFSFPENCALSMDWHRRPATGQLAREFAVVCCGRCVSNGHRRASFSIRINSDLRNRWEGGGSRGHRSRASWGVRNGP